MAAATRMRQADPAAVRVSQDVITATTRLRRRLLDLAYADELTAAQTSVVTLLAKSGASSASALAAIEGVRPQSMAATLAALAERGLIRRDADPDDGRRQVVTLTKDGEAMYRGGRAHRRAWLADALTAQLTPDEIGMIGEAAELLDRISRS